MTGLIHEREQEQAWLAFRAAIHSYTEISDETWQGLRSICQINTFSKHATLYSLGQIPRSFCFIVKGLIRGYALNAKGHEYNKMFFHEGMFPGSMTALLTGTAATQAFEAIEPSLVIDIDFTAYRQLMMANEELKTFQILYLEKNWVLAKDAREVEIVQQDASVRYQGFLQQHAELVDRIPQYHIASHLGITPTQLSRIRKKLI